MEVPDRNVQGVKCVNPDEAAIGRWPLAFGKTRSATDFTDSPGQDKRMNVLIRENPWLRFWGGQRAATSDQVDLCFRA
jgi:hypothetical protein